MSSASRHFRLVCLAALLMAGCAPKPASTVLAPVVDAGGALTVCADPNNLPFSNARGEGFENRIAELVASDLSRPLRYVWWPQRRGFARNTLNAGTCELIIGVPVQHEPAATTRPYYTSTYAFVTREADGLRIHSFDDPRLRSLRIGIHAVGDDYGSVPPALALAARGIVDNLTGFSVQGDYGEPHPPTRLLEALAAKRIDVAIAWGPLAGYFASRARVPLQVQPVPAADTAAIPMRYAIAMAVRRGDTTLRARLDDLLQRRAPEIAVLLAEYGVPTAPSDGMARARVATP